MLEEGEKRGIKINKIFFYFVFFFLEKGGGKQKTYLCKSTSQKRANEKLEPL